jgi:hypothetical protein
MSEEETWAYAGANISGADIVGVNICGVYATEQTSLV